MVERMSTEHCCLNHVVSYTKLSNYVNDTESLSRCLIKGMASTSYTSLIDLVYNLNVLYFELP